MSFSDHQACPRVHPFELECITDRQEWLSMSDSA
jgi:hypothetical protein